MKHLSAETSMFCIDTHSVVELRWGHQRHIETAKWYSLSRAMQGTLVTILFILNSTQDAEDLHQKQHSTSKCTCDADSVMRATGCAQLLQFPTWTEPDTNDCKKDRRSLKWLFNNLAQAGATQSSIHGWLFSFLCCSRWSFLNKHEIAKQSKPLLFSSLLEIQLTA
eukprot:1157935-Pelagomonas_calceolata.AAC.19